MKSNVNLNIHYTATILTIPLFGPYHTVSWTCGPVLFFISSLCGSGGVAVCSVAALTFSVPNGAAAGLSVGLSLLGRATRLDAVWGERPTTTEDREWSGCR